MPDSFLETIQIKCVLHLISLLEDLHRPPLQQRRKQSILKAFYKATDSHSLIIIPEYVKLFSCADPKILSEGVQHHSDNVFYFSLWRALAHQRNAIKIWKCHLKLQIRIEIVSVFTSHICQPYWQSCLWRHMKGLTRPLLFFLFVALLFNIW